MVILTLANTPWFNVGMSDELQVPPDYLPRVFDSQAKKKFLDSFSQFGHATNAAAEAGFTLSTVYRARQNDPIFAAAYEDALHLATRALEDEARRRAFEGWNEPVYGQVTEYDESGKPTSSSKQVVGEVRKYSDTLLTLLLRAYNKQFRLGNINEVSGPGGGPIQVSSAKELTSEQLMQIAATAIDVSSEQTGSDQ